MKSAIIISIILVNFYYALANSCGEAAIKCGAQRKGRFISFKHRRPEVISAMESMSNDDSKLLRRETNFDEKIRCSYEFKNLSGMNPDAVQKLYSDICIDLKNEFNYIFNSSTRCRPLLKRESQNDGTVKISETKRSPLGYIWQAGGCKPESENYFLKIKNTSSIAKLLANSFILVKEDQKFLTFYANPGYLVQLEKNEKSCKKNKNCDLKVILKKHLSSAILDANKNLYTNESIY